jgi:hypothetical protein
MLPFQSCKLGVVQGTRKERFLEQPPANTIANGLERLELIRFNRSYQITDVARVVNTKGGVEKLT